MLAGWVEAHQVRADEVRGDGVVTGDDDVRFERRAVPFLVIHGDESVDDTQPWFEQQSHVGDGVRQAHVGVQVSAGLAVLRQ